MIKLTRHSENPILTPNEDIAWQAKGMLNGCPLKTGDGYHFLFRSISERRRYYDHDLEISQISHVLSSDGLHFQEPELFITPEYAWEQFGCEDPRLTQIGDRFYIFYTALSDYPHTPGGIKIGLAVTQDFHELLFKHQATDFNSKAMTLFPEKINGRLTALLTVNPDLKPPKIALISFAEEEQMWSPDYWHEWLKNLDENALSLQRDPADHVEIGAPPLKTPAGWLLIHSYIKNYLKPPAVFGIEALLLDLKDPRQILGRSTEPLLFPKEEYEIYGNVPNVIFPSGALIEDKKLRVYYGAADTTFCLAETDLDPLLDSLLFPPKTQFSFPQQKEIKMEKYSGNPILEPLKEHSWESKYAFNPTAVQEGNKIYIIYRAMGDNDTSVLGLAISPDGFRIEERLPEPIYFPRAEFEKKIQGGYSGCEDPRLTKIGDTFYLCYTAYDGLNPTKVALSTIKVKDFLKKNWQWTPPQIISCPQRSDKNACLFPEKINDQYVFFHRIGGCLWLDYVSELKFGQDAWLGGKMIASPQPEKWDSRKIGIAGPPLKTPDGWLLIYHGLSREDDHYRLGAFLLDPERPDDIIAKLPYPILEPTENYEHEGLRAKTVFSCGAVIKEGKIFVYYGAADQFVGVATTPLEPLLTALKQNPLPSGIDG